MPYAIDLEPGVLGYFLSLSLGIINAAFSLCGVELITLLVVEVCLPIRRF
jgi:hypothetical protein